MRKIIPFLLILSSCNFRPPYNRPEMEIPEHFRFAAENPEEYVNMAWWEQFGDPALNELIRCALQNNQDLQVASARVLEFQAKYKVAFSQFFPEFAASTFSDRLKVSEDVNFSPIPPGVPNVNTLNRVLAALSYEVDFWGTIRNSAAAAKAQYLARVDARNIVILSLISSVAKAYIQLQEFDFQLIIAQETVDFRAEALRIARLRFEAGLVSNLPVRQAESELQSAEVQVKNFEELIGQQEDLISLLLGTPPASIARGKMLKDLKLPPSVPVGLPSDLLQRRPDILMREQEMIAANAQIGVARAAFFPVITLTADRGQMSTDFSEFFKNSAALFDLFIDVEERLYMGGRLTGQLNEAEALFLETAHSYQQTVLTAFKEVSDALIAHEKSKEKLKIQIAQVEVLQDYLRLAQLRYFNGQNDYLTVVESEKNLFQVELEMVSTQADLFLSLIDLYKALGQGWDVAPVCVCEPREVDPPQSQERCAEVK
jgi:multidrug efflux system outer membrane protein